MDTDKKFLTVNGKQVEIGDEVNILATIRKAGIDIPTFCYRPELSIYGACRLCLVRVTNPNMGIVASCSIKPMPGMEIITDDDQIRSIRKINAELLIANHKRECTTCVRAENCQLQQLASRLGIDEIRYKQLTDFVPVDKSSKSIIRDSNKCVLCGNCVRVCNEVQTVGAIDFSQRGSLALVSPAFNKGLGESECINCGQCVAMCPTGALTVKQDQKAVFKALHNPEKKVAAQIAPSVRVALGEAFGFAPGENVEGKIFAALRKLGFDYVYDTNFGADLTIFEEAEELIRRVKNNGTLPMFTSCCPGWVKFAETMVPGILPNLSTCKSPQEMQSALMKDVLPGLIGCEEKDLVVVSVMPCTAKKFEADLDKFKRNGVPATDHVITTTELITMIKSAGIDFANLEPEEADAPFGLGTGAGVIFGTTGGVLEAALRYAAEKINGKQEGPIEFLQTRGSDYRKEFTVKLNGLGDVKIAVVHTLGEARKIAEEVQNGNPNGYLFIEVMACPGGCVAGGGQPIEIRPTKKQARAVGLYKADKTYSLNKSQENPAVLEAYDKFLGGEVNSHKAHELLHTTYEDRSDLLK